MPLDVPGAVTYIEKSDGTLVRVAGLTGGQGDKGDPGPDGADGPVLMADTMSSTIPRRLNDTICPPGDVWLNTVETPVTIQCMRNIWYASTVQTGPINWVKPAAYAWAVFVAPVAGVLHMTGYSQVSNDTVATQIGAAIWNKLNANAEAVISRSGTTSGCGIGYRRNLWIGAALNLAEKDIYRFAPGIFVESGATAYLRGSMIQAVFYPYATMKGV